jgi:hypothetical protein
MSFHLHNEKKEGKTASSPKRNKKKKENIKENDFSDINNSGREKTAKRRETTGVLTFNNTYNDN